LKLADTELTALLGAIVGSFPNRGKFGFVLAQPPVARLFDTLTSPMKTLDVQYFDVLQRANGEGWIGDLLTVIRSQVPVNPALVMMIDGFAGLRLSVPGIPPHLELVLDGAPFVNHQQLRSALFSMTQPGGARVMQVTGDQASGKSYSHVLISHVGRRFGAEIYLAPDLDGATRAVELVGDIAQQLDFDPVPEMPDAPQDLTVVKRLVRWVAAEGRKLETDFWLVFDGFDSISVNDEVLAFLSGLAQSIGKGQPERLRLFLLGWNRAISGTPPGRIFEQPLTAFARSHVHAYIDDLVAQFAMPQGFSTTDELLEICYQGWDDATDNLTRAARLTERLQKVAQAAREALPPAGGGS
jgi:hypothetical protein